METKDNSTRALVLLILMSIMAALLLAMTATSVVWYLELSGMSHEDSYYIDYYVNSPYAMFFGVATILYSLSTIFTGISYLLWFQRVYTNLVSIGIKHFTYKAYMVWLSWFIPFMNLVVPYKIMKEVWDETENLNRDESEKYHKETSYTLVNAWWVFFLVMTITNTFSSNIITAGSFTDLQLGVLLSACGSFAGILSLICLFKIIIKVKNRENSFFIRYKENGLMSDYDI